MGVEAVGPEGIPHPPAREIAFEFRGRGGEYFRIWIVNLLLMIVTLGIYSAWAKVRRLRYFYGSTSLDGHAFDYHGRPIAILKGRLIAFAIYIVLTVGTRMAPILSVVLLPVILFGMPWIVMRARRFQMRMTSWRGLRFGFHGKYGGSLAAFVGWALLGIVTLGVMLPFAMQRQARYILGNSSYGNQQFAFTAGPGRFYSFWLITLVMSIGMSILASIVGVVLLFAMGVLVPMATATTTTPAAATEAVRQFMLSGGFILPVVFALAIALPAAYFQRSFLNVSFGSLQIGRNDTRAQLRTWPLAWIMISNLVATVCTLGLFYPWARVRLVRYQLAHTTLLARGDLDEFTAGAPDGTSAVGEEISDFFDLDFGF